MTTCQRQAVANLSHRRAKAGQLHRGKSLERQFIMNRIMNTQGQFSHRLSRLSC